MFMRSVSTVGTLRLLAMVWSAPFTAIEGELISGRSSASSSLGLVHELDDAAGIRCSYHYSF
jgi:hypothetical protein